MFKRTVDSILDKFHETILHLEEHADVSQVKANDHLEQYKIHQSEASRALDVASKIKGLINA